MEGSATLTIEVSSMTTNWAETSSPRATERRRCPSRRTSARDGCGSRRGRRGAGRTVRWGSVVVVVMVACLVVVGDLSVGL